jgi:5'-nucleotidase
MRILIVNDDGILAPGLAALREAVASLGEVVVIAPDSPQSAVGRALTLHGPIVCEPVEVGGQFWGIGVGGRPADCVKLAVRELMDARPDLVLSGINAGANVGVNVYYSGTVAAAAEGALLGIPSIAFSLDISGEMNFALSAKYCRQVLDGLLTLPMAHGDLVNVNIPILKNGNPRGVKVVPQSTAAITESYHRQEEGKRMTFRMTDYYEHGPQHAESDVTALGEGYITVTPLHSDMTNRSRLGQMVQFGWPELR